LSVAQGFPHQGFYAGEAKASGPSRARIPHKIIQDGENGSLCDFDRFSDVAAALIRWNFAITTSFGWMLSD
jgi:hypothetical protein